VVGTTSSKVSLAMNQPVSLWTSGFFGFGYKGLGGVWG
jgi:hypothetical protein